LDGAAQAMATARLHVEAARRGDVALDYQTMVSALKLFEAVINKTNEVTAMVFDNDMRRGGRAHLAECYGDEVGEHTPDDGMEPPIELPRASAVRKASNWPERRIDVIKGEIRDAIKARQNKGEIEAMYWFNGADTKDAVIGPVFEWVQMTGYKAGDCYNVHCDDPTPSGSVLMHISW
jgi:hypothetical protein